MSFAKNFIFFKQTRINVIKVVEGLTFEELHVTPRSFKNNVIWNVLHIHVTQQLLLYRLSSLPVRVNERLVDSYRKGTFPPQEEQKISESEFTTLKREFLDEDSILKRNYEEGLFKQFTKYQTSYGVSLENFEDAMFFNNVHESIHLGYLMALRKAIR